MADTKKTDEAKPESMDRIITILKLIEKYGFATVLCLLGIFVFIVPMRDGHLEFLRQVAAAVQSIGQSNQKAAESIDKLSESIEAVQKLAEEQGRSNVTGAAMSQEHLRLTKETHGDVKEIKAAVLPK